MLDWILRNDWPDYRQILVILALDLRGKDSSWWECRPFVEHQDMCRPGRGTMIFSLILSLWVYTCSFRSAMVACIVLIFALAISFSFVRTFTLCSSASDCFFSVSFSACLDKDKSRNLIDRNQFHRWERRKMRYLSRACSILIVRSSSIFCWTPLATCSTPFNWISPLITSSSNCTSSNFSVNPVFSEVTVSS